MSDPASGFSTGWLRQREPFDEVARADSAPLVGWIADRPAGSAPWRVLDLACGTGANLRALAPRLGPGQQWQVVDHDPALLAALPDALASWAAGRGHRVDLDGDPALQGTLRLRGAGFSATVVRRRLDLLHGLDSLGFPAGGLVTASALLDLVSVPWLQALLDRALPARAALLFALTVDARLAWDPADPEDRAVQALFEQHQHRDKGFGPALGAQAAAWTVQYLAAAGWPTRQARSDWLIDGAEAPDMLRAMLDGAAGAACEQSPADAARVQAWAQRRHAALRRSRLRVGHLDIAARPAGAA
jgi:SAM-dependent methyltransferase